MSLEDLVSMALSPGNLALATRVNLALVRLYRYTAAAAAQNDRMWDAHRARVAARTDKQQDRFRFLEGEVAVAMHFYFVCWDAIAKTLSQLRHPPIGVASADRIYTRHRSVLEQYQLARNHFEHYDERLPLGRRSRDQYRKSESGQSLSYEFPFITPDGFVRYYDEKWDVRPESVVYLRQIVEEFRRDLRKELRAMVRRAKEGSASASLP